MWGGSDLIVGEASIRLSKILLFDHWKDQIRISKNFWFDFRQYSDCRENPLDCSKSSDSIVEKALNRMSKKLIRFSKKFWFYCQNRFSSIFDDFRKIFNFGHWQEKLYLIAEKCLIRLWKNFRVDVEETLIWLSKKL